MSAGFALDKIFFLFVICVVAVAPFIAIWRFPATLLTKSLATVVALLFFTMALMFLLQCVSKNYAGLGFVPSLYQIGKNLSDEKINPADVSAVIREWQSSGKGFHALKDALHGMQPTEPAEPPPEVAEPPAGQPPAEEK